MYSVYILYSLSSGKTYTGFSDDVKRRLFEHNVSEKKGYTLRYRPWLLIHEEVYMTKVEAMARERYLKSGRGREEVKRILSKYLAN